MQKTNKTFRLQSQWPPLPLVNTSTQNTQTGFHLCATFQRLEEKTGLMQRYRFVSPQRGPKCRHCWTHLDCACNVLITDNNYLRNDYSDNIPFVWTGLDAVHLQTLRQWGMQQFSNGWCFLYRQKYWIIARQTISVVRAEVNNGNGPYDEKKNPLPVKRMQPEVKVEHPNCMQRQQAAFLLCRSTAAYHCTVGTQGIAEQHVLKK